MRLYDSRMIKTPLHWWREQLPTTGNPQHVSCVFSPDNSLIVSGANLTTVYMCVCSIFLTR